MFEDAAEKSHDPTPRRRQQARDQGHLPKSQDLVSAGMLLVGLVMLSLLGGRLVQHLGQLTVEGLGAAPLLQANAGDVTALWNTTCMRLSGTLLPMLTTLVLAAVGIHVAQVGIRLFPQNLVPDLQRVSLVRGAHRAFSARSYARVVFALLNAIVVLAVAAWCLWSEREAIASLSALESPQIGLLITQTAMRACVKIVIALAVLAALDYAWQRFQYERDLKMSPEELREETKISQIDPQLAARRRGARRQITLDRLDWAIRQADVIVTGSRQLAVAIRFDPVTMAAPLVSAKGASFLGERISQLGRQHGIACFEQQRLAQALFRSVELQQPVGLKHYAAVAELLAEAASAEPQRSAQE